MLEKIDTFLERISENRSRRWKVLLAIAIVAVMIRIGLSLLMPGIGPPRGMDADNYNRIAGALLRGEGFRLWSRPTTFVAPVYPYFLASVYWVFGVHFLVAKIIQAGLWGVTTLLVYAIGVQLFNPKVGILASALVAVHPELVGISSYLYTETLFILLLMLLAKCFITALETQKGAWYALSGGILGLATLCRGTTLLLPLMLFGLLFVTKRLRQNLAYLTVLSLAMIAVILPWTYRNYRVCGAFVPVATGGGEVFWVGNYLPFQGEYRYHETRQRIEELTSGLSLVEKDRLLMREAAKSIREHLGASLKLFAKKVYRFWVKVYENVPEGKPRSPNALIQATVMLIHVPLLLLAAYGIAKSGIGRIEVLFVLGILAYFMAVHVITLAVPRYRIPVMPFVILFAAFGLSRILEFASRRTDHGSR